MRSKIMTSQHPQVGFNGRVIRSDRAVSPSGCYVRRSVGTPCDNCRRSDSPGRRTLTLISGGGEIRSRTCCAAMATSATRETMGITRALWLYRSPRGHHRTKLASIRAGELRAVYRLSAHSFLRREAKRPSWCCIKTCNCRDSWSHPLDCSHPLG
jgi:hypothetical protein